MKSYFLIISGLRHHDFKGRLDELYRLAPGRRMSISIEHNNPGEQDAVIVYCGKDFVGYVRSGSDKNLAVSLIKSSGRDSLLGRIKGVDRENNWLMMEITSEAEELPEIEPLPCIFDNWEYDGEVLPCNEANQHLHTMISNLLMTTEEKDPWDEDMEQWLEYIGENLWRDMSRETFVQLHQIISYLKAGKTLHPEYEQKAKRIDAFIDRMGSPEVRKKQVEEIFQIASSWEIEDLLLRKGDKAREDVQKLPEEIRSLFSHDGEKCMARIWYYHIPTCKILAIKTLLAIMIRLKNEETQKDSGNIPEEWLLNWCSRQKDKTKAAVVKEFIGLYELEKIKPKLVHELQQMDDACNMPMQETEAIRKQTEALKEVAKKPTIQAEHYHAGTSTFDVQNKHLHIEHHEDEDSSHLLSEL